MSIAQSLGPGGPAPALPPPIAPADGSFQEIPKVDSVPRHGSPPTGASDGQIGGQLAAKPESAVNWDRLFRALVGRLNGSLSPPGLLLAYLDWLLHLGFSPGKQWDLAAKALCEGVQFGLYAAAPASCRARRPPSSRRRKTTASAVRSGSNGPSTCTTSHSCSRSNGCTAPPVGWTA